MEKNCCSLTVFQNEEGLKTYLPLSFFQCIFIDYFTLWICSNVISFAFYIGFLQNGYLEILFDLDKNFCIWHKQMMSASQSV